jgi:RNA polymerase sigma-70 factor (ECF subfamily)
MATFSSNRTLEGASPGDDSAREQAWAERARAGDPAAFRAIFDRYAGPVRRFLRDLLRDAAAADEATQETFVRAHARLESLRDGQRLTAWLFGIARNVWLEQRRQRVGISFEDEESGAEVVAAVLPAPSPETLLLDREVEAALHEALTSLSESRRAALLLRIDHGLGYEEIAAVMGWTLAKVKNEIHRGRLQLRVKLAQVVR